jgi:hypothetical protein
MNRRLINARELTETLLLRLLNRSLRFQGIYDAAAVQLSKDFTVALVIYKGQKVAVQSMALLPRDTFSKN